MSLRGAKRRGNLLCRWRYRPDLLAIFFPVERKIIVLPPSSRRQATVHRTVAFRFSNLSAHNKNPNPNGFGFSLCLMVTFDAGFFCSHYFKNPEKSCNYHSQVSTFDTISGLIVSISGLAISSSLCVRIHDRKCFTAGHPTDRRSCRWDPVP